MSQIVETINDAICDRPEILLAELGIDDNIINDHMDIPCPIHDGDRLTGCTLYFNEYNGYRGRFICNTRGCHNTFKKTLIGFVRGILSNRYCEWSKPGDKIYSWTKTLKFLKGLYGINGESVYDPGTVDRKNFIRSCYCIEDKKVKNLFTKERYLFYYNQPSDYFLGRGFSKEVLEKYNVRHCSRPNSKYFGRSIVPVFDDENRWIIGMSARITDDSEPKWVFNKGFPAGSNLFNYRFAGKYIERSRKVIILESPGNVMRLYDAGIYDCVAIWGAAGFNDYKRYLLDKLGVMKVILALDNDEAGKAGSQKFREQYGRYYNTIEISLPDTVNDVADLSVSKVKEIFNDYIR